METPVGVDGGESRVQSWSLKISMKRQKGVLEGDNKGEMELTVGRWGE